jgi:hypothetical protein
MLQLPMEAFNGKPTIATGWNEWKYFAAGAARISVIFSKMGPSRQGFDTALILPH